MIVLIIIMVHFFTQQKEMLEADLKTVYTELLDEAGLSLAEEQKNFFDYLHFSPIKVRHLNMVSNFFYELSVHKIY